MGLFANADGTDGAPQRMAITRERGTRRLILTFVVLIAAWFLFGKINDQYLLRTKWSPLSPDVQGLTIVATLDRRGDYDRNMFRIVQANQTSRAELTDYGWQTIFTGRDGELFTDSVGETIQSAIQVDGATGYAMLEPFLRVGIARLQGKSNVSGLVNVNTPITVEERSGTQLTTKQVPLGQLLERFAEKGGPDTPEKSSDGSSGGERAIERGLAIPGDTLARTCPVALTGKHFVRAELEEHPATLLQKKTYTVHLWLSPEGRSRFYQWSRDHNNESLAFVLKGSLATAARVEQTLDVNDWQIGPITDADSAKALVNFVNSQNQKT